MGRKFGKKNIIKVDPLAYNLGLIGESGIGKTTLAKEVCDKLVGEDGYLVFNIGKEDGIDAVPGAMYENIEDWAKFDEVTLDIIDNKETHYKDLKVLVYDTLDELFQIAEPEVVRLHNRENPDKRVTSIRAAFGGFMKGEDKATEIILDRIWELKRVGVSMFIIGHTKNRTMTDVVTGNEYDILTTNMAHRYFNAVKTKLHILGVASINRNIETTTDKNIMGKTITTGKVVDESRLVTFRDNNFNIDSKSRFADIVDHIPLDANEFIKALEDAIKSAHDKQAGALSIKEAQKIQEAEKEEITSEYIQSKNSVNEVKNHELIEHIKANVSNLDVVKMQTIMKEYGFTDFTDPTKIETEALTKIKALIK